MQRWAVFVVSIVGVAGVAGCGSKEVVGTLALPGEIIGRIELAEDVVRRAALAGQSPAPCALEPDAGRPASHDQVERFHAHFEQALVAIEFLDPQAPKKLVPRMRRLFARAGLTAEEVDLLRGVCKQILLAAEGRLPGRRKRPSP